MGRVPRSVRRRWFRLALLSIVVGMAPFSCAEKGDPFAVGARGTPTPTAVAGETPRPTETPPWVDHEGKAIVRFAEWEDRSVQLANAMTGYILVHGYDYAVEIVPLAPADGQAAMLNGDIDIITMLDRTAAKAWYDRQISAGAIIDLGSIYESRQDIRIVGTATLEERAPELVAFFGKVKPGDDAFDNAAGAISPSRTGVSPVVASIIYFKGNGATWPGWMPPEVAARLNSAIDVRKTSLRNRACVPTATCGLPKSR